ncbi:MAG: exodeoxyribonuclease III [Gammaproteobacteria bacterium]
MRSRSNVLRVITLNANGIRSAQRKGFFAWLAKQSADLVCIQETKAQRHDLDKVITAPPGYLAYFHDAERQGYSGVAIYSKTEPDRVVSGLGIKDFDGEGRYLQADFGALSVVSLYLPSGSSGPERQAAKFDFLDRFLPVLAELRSDGRDYILCGDWNIAHRPIDLKNWRANQKNSGFLPEERAWLDRVFGVLGYVDAFRAVNQEAEQYTWWSNRGQSWAKNVGWRIDYQVVTPDLKSVIRRAAIYKSQRFSDHAPLTIDYALML